jgi:alpha-amylase
VDYDEKTKEMGVYSILNEYGPLWEEMIDDEKGNYDYLMYSDIEYRNPSVKKEIKKWSKWYYETAAFDGVRLDAVKHINPQFYGEWLDYIRQEINPNLFAVGEYWAPGNIPLLLKYIEATGERMSLFDASLHHNLYTASKTGRKYDLTQIFSDCLVSVKPHLAVTIVANHDTQPLQTLEAPIDDWFKPLAYALTLLREAGYPCVFYPDLYGATYLDENEPEGDPIILKKVPELKNLLLARKQYAHGPQKDYFDFPSCIGWTREGVNELENSGCAVIISNGNEGFKNMEVGKQHAGKTFVDLLKKHPAEVMINEDGWGEFFVRAASVSVWVCKS